VSSLSPRLSSENDTPLVSARRSRSISSSRGRPDLDRKRDVSAAESRNFLRASGVSGCSMTQPWGCFSRGCNLETVHVPQEGATEGRCFIARYATMRRPTVLLMRARERVAPRFQGDIRGARASRFSRLFRRISSRATTVELPSGLSRGRTPFRDLIKPPGRNRVRKRKLFASSRRARKMRAP